MKTAIERLNKLLDCNLSIIPIDQAKTPIIAWKKYQTELISKEELLKHYDRAYSFGIATGYNNVEVIDIDLKILDSPTNSTVSTQGQPIYFKI
mgnify:CR=1 FL=1